MDFAPLRHYGQGEFTVVDPRFGTGPTPTQPSGWGDGGGGTTPTDPGTILVDTGEIWVDTDYTGATDASADINAALQLAYDLGHAPGPTQITVRLKPGILRLNNNLHVGRQSRLVGSGMRATRLVPTGSCHAIAHTGVNTYSSAPDDIWVSDLEIDGAQQTGFGAAYKGITGSGGLRTTFRNLYVHHTAATGIGWDTFGGTIENCWAIGCGRNAKATPNMPGNSGFGIGVGHPNTYPPASDYPNWCPISVSNCHSIDNGNYGFFFETQNAANTPVGMSIIGCTARTNGRDGIGLDGGAGTIIQGCTVHDNAEAGIGLNWGTMGVDKGGHPTKRAIILGNHIENNTFGVRGRTDGTTYDLADLMVKDNMILGSTSEGVLMSAAGTGVHQRLWVAGNYIEGGTAGVRAIGGQTITRLAIEGNRITGATGAAVSVETPTAAARVTGNEAWANGSGVYFNTALSHTGSVVDTSWVEGTSTVPS